VSSEPVPADNSETARIGEQLHGRLLERLARRLAAGLAYPVELMPFEHPDALIRRDDHKVGLSPGRLGGTHASEQQ
jgi:hypothetical protein